MGDDTKQPKKPRSAQHVGDTDSFFWIAEKDPLLRNTITAVFRLEKSPDEAIVRDRLERASRIVPGWRHRLVTPPLRMANPRWVVDADFDLDFHLRWIGAPKEKTFASVLEYASAHAMSGLDRDRPLWMFTVVDGLDDDAAAVIIKVHHALTDGVGGVAMLPLVVDLSPEPDEPGPLPPLPVHEPMGRRALAVDAIETNRDRVVDFVRSTGATALRSGPGLVLRPAAAARAARRNVQALGRVMTPPSEPLSPIMTARRGWTQLATVDADLGALRRAAKPRGVTVNDAFIAAVAYGFARYHERLGEPISQLRVATAVSTRQPGDPAYGNRVMGGHFVLPVGTDDPAGLMQIAHGIIADLREDIRQPLSRAAGTLVNAMGPLVSGFVGPMMRNCDIAVTNVAGIDEPIWLGGAEILATYGFGPAMGTSTNATLLSYRDTAHIGLNIDSGAVPEAEVLVDSVREGCDVVAGLAGD